MCDMVMESTQSRPKGGACNFSERWARADGPDSGEEDGWRGTGWVWVLESRMNVSITAVGVKSP